MSAVALRPGSRRSAQRLLGRIDFAAARRFPLREARAIADSFSLAIAGTATAVLCTEPDANPKLGKSGKVLGRPTVGLMLLPGTELGSVLSDGATTSVASPVDALGAAVLAAYRGVDSCLHATDGCRAACLNRSGHGQFSSTIAARAWRAALLLAHPLAFVRLLLAELSRWARKFKRDRVRGAVRLNVVSDHDWSAACPALLSWILRQFGKGSGYDYTASPDPARHARHRALGWDLSLSVKCASQLDRYLPLLDSDWVARLVVVLPIRARKVAGELPALPSSFAGRLLVDGDVHDYRPADGRGVVVGLRVKDTFGRSSVVAAIESGFALLEVAA